MLWIEVTMNLVWMVELGIFFWSKMILGVEQFPAHWELTQLMCLLSIDVSFSGTAWACSDVPFPG